MFFTGANQATSSTRLTRAIMDTGFAAATNAKRVFPKLLCPPDICVTRGNDCGAPMAAKFKRDQTAAEAAASRGECRKMNDVNC